MAAETLAGFARRFAWVLDDLSALVPGRRLVAEGWGLRPELVAPVVESVRQMVVLVPTAEFRAHQLTRLPRASNAVAGVSDPERANRNRWSGTNWSRRTRWRRPSGWASGLSGWTGASTANS